MTSVTRKAPELLQQKLTSENVINVTAQRYVLYTHSANKNLSQVFVLS